MNWINTFYLFIVTIALLIIAYAQISQYKLDYNYLYDNIPMCEPEKKEIET